MEKNLLKWKAFLFSAFLFTCASTQAQVPVVTKSQPAGNVALQRLEREIARLSKNSGGIVGASVIHIETGRRISLNGNERFPMASTFNVPIAVQSLTRVDKGE